MGIREKLNENPGITTGVTIGIIAIALIYIIDSQFTHFVFGEGSGGRVYSQAFYSSDDGATMFADEQGKLPPFDKDGKTAVRAYVFKCKNGDKFIGYLEKLSDSAKKKMSELQDKTPDDPMVIQAQQEAMRDGTFIKKPGAASKWVLRDTKEGHDVAEVKCPDGSDEAPSFVMPGD